MNDFLIVFSVLVFAAIPALVIFGIVRAIYITATHRKVLTLRFIISKYAFSVLKIDAMKHGHSHGKHIACIIEAYCRNLSSPYPPPPNSETLTASPANQQYKEPWE